MLNALISAIACPARVIVDERFAVGKSFKENISVVRVRPTIWNRLLAEKWLFNNVEKGSYVLCFGNLPPLFRLRGVTVLFLQNRYLIEENSLRGFSFKIRLRLFAERWWSTIGWANVDKFVVQTPTMKTLLSARLKRAASIEVMPFLAEPQGYERGFLKHNTRGPREFDFVYVASGEPHKNHRRLLEAWGLLSKEGFFPSLCLTLDEGRSPELCFFIDEMRQRLGVRIVNVGVVAHSGMSGIYGRSAALIYPSKLESFGLPLIEARQAGLPVIASELDYVRDVLDPEQVFDPNSSISIARAVKRFLGDAESALPILDASQFLCSIMKKGA